MKKKIHLGDRMQMFVVGDARRERTAQASADGTTITEAAGMNGGCGCPEALELKANEFGTLWWKRWTRHRRECR